MVPPLAGLDAHARMPTWWCAVPATSNPDHLTENVAAMRGPLPDPDTREINPSWLQG